MTVFTRDEHTTAGMAHGADRNLGYCFGHGLPQLFQRKKEWEVPHSRQNLPVCRTVISSAWIPGSWAYFLPRFYIVPQAPSGKRWSAVGSLHISIWPPRPGTPALWPFLHRPLPGFLSQRREFWAAPRSPRTR